MRTTSRRRAKSAPAPIHEPDPAPEAVEPEDDDRPRVERIDRIGVPVRSDGTIDIDSMRPATRERLKRAVTDPTLGPRLGVSGPAPDSLFDPQVLGILYEAAGSLMVSYAMRAGYSLDQSLVLRFSEDEKRSLCPLTARVLDKWIPSSGKYQDEVMLGLSLFGIISGKLSLLKKPAPVIHMVQPTPAPQPEPSA